MLNDNKKIHILLKYSYKKTSEEIFYDLLKKYGNFDYKPENIIFIGGDCMNKNIFLDNNNLNIKIFDKIYYFEEIPIF